MDWDDDSRSALEVALNEADVLGIRLEPQGRWCDLLLHVLALPETGPIDPDARRVLRLLSPTEVKVLLRNDRPEGYGPAIPLSDLDDVESFFESLTWTGSMYGWKFFDDPGLTADWPARPSLTINLRPDAGDHTLFWFNECGRDERQLKVAYCIEGVVRFDALEVLDAVGRPLALETFVAEGHRWWEALHGGDDRLSVEAQQRAQHGTPTWRSRLPQATTTTVSGPRRIGAAVYRPAGRLASAREASLYAVLGAHRTARISLPLDGRMFRSRREMRYPAICDGERRQRAAP